MWFPLPFQRQAPLVDAGLAATSDAPSSASKKGKRSKFGLRKPSFLKKSKSSTSEVREREHPARFQPLGGNAIVHFSGDKVIFFVCGGGEDLSTSVTLVVGGVRAIARRRQCPTAAVTLDGR